MSTNHDWTYYRLDRILTDDPPIFFRSWRGFVDRLDRQAMTWVSLDSDPVSRYLKNGEVGFDEITRARIETTPENVNRHHGVRQVRGMAKHDVCLCDTLAADTDTFSAFGLTFVASF